MQKRIALFASHFLGNSIPSYIKVYLKELLNTQSKTWLIHTGDKLSEEELKWLKSEQIHLINRSNKGHDFGSWQYAISQIDVNSFETFILANDSCFCTQPLTDLIHWFETSPTDFGGLINSNERQYHIQSFLMVMNIKGMMILQKSFKKNGIITDKKKLIKAYEIGLTKLQQKAKNKVNSFIEIPKSNKDNPMFHQTLQQIDTGFHLVKKQLVLGILSTHDREAMRSAGIYVGPQVIKDAIMRNSTIDVDWDNIFKT